MPSHKFKIGQTVRLSAAGIDRGAGGHYRVVALMPEERGDRQYRIQSASGSQQRVAWESQLSAVNFS
jgi:hypothetical protein